MKPAAIAIPLLLVTACGPIGPIPGGRLSGKETAAAPTDWSFSDDGEDVQLETRPSDPYSVNIWGAGIGSHFFVASGKGAEAEWAQHIVADPNVRLRVGDTLYDLRAVRVEDDASRDQFLAAGKRKYDWQPSGDEAENAWLFRLDPR